MPIATPNQASEIIPGIVAEIFVEQIRENGRVSLGEAEVFGS